MPAWVPEWRISVGDDVYTTVTAASLTTGRTDIDRQPNAGYSRVEIVNTTGVDFTIDIGDAVLLELKNSTGTYVPVFGGSVTDFSISVKSPEDGGFITTGTILSAGNLTRLAKYVYTAALAEGLDGAQIATILGAALNLSWAEVTPTVTWATYPPTVTWATAESYVGTVDSGVYTMIATTAGTPKAETLADQIATSALGQLYEDKSTGNVNYDDADHREVYVNAYGYTSIDANYATPSSIKSITQSGKIRNSLIYKYGTGYGSTYSTSDATAIATYGKFEYQTDSNIKNLTNITAVGTRELSLRANPYAQFQAITFRLDNSNMPSATRDVIINSFFGQPIQITNLPTNMFGGTFKGFLEGYSINSTPTYVDVTLNLSPAKFSLPIAYGNYTLTQTITTAGNTTFTVPSGVSQIAVLAKAYGGNGAAGATSGGDGAAGGAGGGGAGAVAFWNYDVVPATNYTVNLDFAGTRNVSFGSLISVSSGANGSTAGGPAAGGAIVSKDAGVIYYTDAAGSASGAAGAARSTNGNGNAGGNNTGTGATLTLPSNIGLPTNFTAGTGGGGGGGGAKGSAIDFNTGGIGGSPLAGSGGNAFQDSVLNGYNAAATTGTGNGGGGGGGGAFQTAFGTGTGGTGSTASGAIVYIYTR
jgi:hypothetical protein